MELWADRREGGGEEIIRFEHTTKDRRQRWKLSDKATQKRGKIIKLKTLLITFTLKGVAKGRHS